MAPEMTPHRLLMVCTANICRSPMAEGLARAYAAERGWAAEIRSAGTRALPGNPPTPNAVKALKELGIDISSQRSQPVSDELVAWADRILVMEMRHAREMREEHPNCDAKVQLLGTFGGVVEIGDPYGGWIWRFRRSRDEIRTCVEHFMDRLPPRPV